MSAQRERLVNWAFQYGVMSGPGDIDTDNRPFKVFLICHTTSCVFRLTSLRTSGLECIMQVRRLGAAMGTSISLGRYARVAIDMILPVGRSDERATFRRGGARRADSNIARYPRTRTERSQLGERISLETGNGFVKRTRTVQNCIIHRQDIDLEFLRDQLGRTGIDYYTEDGHY